MSSIDKTKQYLKFMDLFVKHIIDAYFDGYISRIDLSLILYIYLYDYCVYGEKWSQDKAERLCKELKKGYFEKYNIKLEFIGDDTE